MILKTIPKKNIVKAKVYFNEKCSKTMAQIRQELGCNYIINTTLFNMSTKDPVGYLYVDGKQISATANPYGLAVKDNNIVFSYGNNVKYPDFTGCYHVLVKDGEIAVTQSESNKYGYAWRSCVGIKANGDIVFLCDQSNRSLIGIAGDLLDAGCVTALNFDGGGSTQCYCNGEQLTTSRNVVAFLCIWTKDNTTTEDDNEDKVNGNTPEPPTVEEKPESEKEEGKMKKILLIAGHGAGDPGATSGDRQEADYTREVVGGLVKALSPICEVSTYPTDQNAYTDYQNGKLRSTANFENYDYILEIHFNAFDGSGSDGQIKGTECYVTTSESAVTVEEAILAQIEACGMTNRGVKYKNWSVINTAKQSGVSSALLEVCFIDDPDDMALYDKKKNDIVKGIALGIQKGFGLSGTVGNPDLDPVVENKPETSEPDVEEPETKPSTDDDVEQAYDWAQEAWVKAHNKIGNDGNPILDGKRPKENLTRQELAIVLNRLGLLD